MNVQRTTADPLAPIVRLASSILLLAVIAGLLSSIAAGAVSAQQAQQEDESSPPPCSSPEASQFDFWLGTWDLTWDGGSGTNTITKIMDSCVIHEQFDGGEFKGTSFSVYEPKAEHWKQTWVDNQGGYLEFVGGLERDRMVLWREAPLRDPPARQRMVFYDITPDSLNWDWEISEDGGKSWNLQWRIHYRRRQ